MNNQAIYSLAIQALHERRDNIQRRTPQNVSAIHECEEAIRHFEDQKQFSLMLSECMCDVSFEIIDPECGDLCGHTEDE